MNYPPTPEAMGWASKERKMQALTLHIELFALHCLLFGFCNLLCRTARCAQPSVPEVNLIRTNIFMCKVLRKNNFSPNHNTSKNFFTKIQQLIEQILIFIKLFINFMSDLMEIVAYIPSAAKLTNGFYAPFYKNAINPTSRNALGSPAQLVILTETAIPEPGLTPMPT